MAQSSFPWTDGTGDGGPYAADTWDNTTEKLFTPDPTRQGVIYGLRVSGTASPVSVAAGAAIVKGKVYISTASENVTVPTPTSQARCDRVVLQSLWSTQTVRIALVQGTEGAGTPPSLTQTDGVRWEIPLATLYVTTGGAITVTDERAEVGVSPHIPGEIKMWSGVLSGHYPVNPRTGVADTRWHLCNGEVEKGVQTPDLRGRMIIGAGGTYSVGDTGGSATKNISHTHGVGTLAASSESSHTHGVGTIAAASESAHTHSGGTLTTTSVQAGMHNHTISADGSHYHTLQYASEGMFPPGYAAPGYVDDTSTASAHSHGGLTGSTNPSAHSHTMASGATGAGSAHTHTLSGSTAAGSAHTHTLSGSTASGGSTALDTLPPYYALAFICYVGD